MSGAERGPSCKEILRAWRAAPTTDFGPAYPAATAMLRDITAASRSGRLDPLTAERMVDGMVVRAGRGDDEDGILAWVSKFAARRGYTWRGSR